MDRRINSILKKRDIATVLVCLILMGALSSCSIPDVFSKPTETTVPTTMETTTVTTTTETTTIPTETEYVPTEEDIVYDFIETITGTLLSRDIEEDEFLTESLLIAHGELSIEDFIRMVVSSDEFSGRPLSDTAKLNLLSDALLGGELSERRSAFFNVELEYEMPMESLIPMLCGSEYFKNICAQNFVPVIDSYPLLSSTDELYDITDTIPEGDFISTVGGYLPSDEVLTEIDEALEQLASHYSSCGFILIDVNTGRGIAYNVERKYYSASSIKAPYAASLCYYIPSTFVDYERTLYNLLVFSDNDAFATLFNRYHREYIQRWAEEAHVPVESVTYKYPKITTRDMFKLWIRNYQYFNDGPDGEYLASLMREPEYSLIHSEFDGIYVTESKAGWMVDEDPGHTTTIDCGVIHTPTGPYILVIESTVPRDIEPLRPLLRALDHAHSEMVAPIVIEETEEAEA